MFFKVSKDPEATKRRADIACWVTFIFWCGFLILNSAWEFFFGGPLMYNSLILLWSGLIVFAITGFSVAIYDKSIQK